MTTKKKPAEGANVVTFRTLKLTVASPDDWDAAAQYDLEQGRIMSALRAILGADGFEQFLALEPAPKLREAGQLLEQIASSAGADLGKSDAPSDTEGATEAS